MDIKQPFTVYIAVSHNPRRNREGISPAAYAIVFEKQGQPHILWGRGGETTAQTMFAHAIMRVRDANLLDPEEQSLEVVAAKTGFAIFLETFVLSWLRQEATSGQKPESENADLWKSAAVLWHLTYGKARSPCDERERKFVRLAHSEAKHQAEESAHRKEFHTREIAATDESEDR